MSDCSGSIEKQQFKENETNLTTAIVTYSRKKNLGFALSIKGMDKAQIKSLLHRYQQKALAVEIILVVGFENYGEYNVKKIYQNPEEFQQRLASEGFVL